MSLWDAIWHLTKEHSSGSQARCCVAARGVLRTAPKCRHRRPNDKCDKCVARLLIKEGRA